MHKSDDMPWTVTKDGVTLRVRLTPKSSRDAIDGFVETTSGSALRARVRAVPEQGKANRALEVAVANWLGLAKSSVAVTAGGKSRMKTVVIKGDPEQLAAQLTALAEARD